MDVLSEEEKKELCECLQDFKNNNLCRKVLMKEKINLLCKIVEYELSDEEEFDVQRTFSSLPKNLLEVVIFKLLSPLDESDSKKEDIFRCLAQLFSALKGFQLFQKKTFIIWNIITRVPEDLWAVYCLWMWIFWKFLGEIPFLGKTSFRLLWMKVDSFSKADHENNLTKVLQIKEVGQLFIKCSQDEDEDYSTLTVGSQSFSINKTIQFLNFLKSIHQPVTLLEAVDLAIREAYKSFFNVSSLNDIEKLDESLLYIRDLEIRLNIGSAWVQDLLRLCAKDPSSLSLLNSFLVDSLENFSKIDETKWTLEDNKNSLQNCVDHLRKNAFVALPKSSSELSAQNLSKKMLQETPNSTNLKFVCDLDSKFICQLVEEYEQIRNTKRLLNGEGGCHNLLLQTVLNAEDSLIRTKSLRGSPARLRSVQLWTIFASLTMTKPARLFEQQTGEGKTLIIAVVAACKAKLHGLKVDIISSNHDLAKTAVEKLGDFYRDFGVRVGLIEEGTDYGCDILYGTISEFVGDYLREAVYGTVNRLERKHSLAIIDEFDNVVIDRGLDITMLSSLSPGMESLWLVHGFIYSVIKTQRSQNSDLRNIHPEFLRKALGMKEYGSNVYPELEDTDDCDLACDQSSTCEQTPAIEDKAEKEEPNSKINDMLPIHLRSVATANVDAYLQNGLDAILYYRKNVQYVKGDGIIPVEFMSTGEAHKNAVYGRGMQQYLQIHEKVCLTPESVTDTFLSNIGYLRKFSQLVCLTGTLGPSNDLQCIEKCLGPDLDFDVAVIPKNRPDRIADLTPLVCSPLASKECELDNWSKNILETAARVVGSKRPLLIICEDISSSKTIKTLLQSRMVDRPPNSMRSYNLNIVIEDERSEFDETQELGAGDIVLTTNIGGRGTDYKLKEVVLEHGGLFVLITFSPPNNRVFRQARGRCGRSGQPGTCQIISSSSLVHREEEHHHLAEELNTLVDFHLKKDELFENVFLPYYSEQRVLWKDKLLPEKHFDLDIIRERFAFLINDLETRCSRNELQLSDIDLQKFREQMIQNETEYDNPLYLVLKGNYQLKCKRYDIATSWYKEALKKDEDLCGASTYLNLAVAFLKERNGKCSVNEGRQVLCSYFKKSMECSNKHVDKLKMLMILTLDQEVNSELAEQISTTMELYDIYSQRCQQMIDTLDKLESDSKIVLKIDDLPFQDKYKTMFEDLLQNNGFLPYLISLEEKKAWKLSWSAVGVTLMGALLLTLGCVTTMCGFVNLGSALIGEGFNDLFTGTFCLWNSKKITLEDYLKSKLISIAISTLTFGIGKCWSFAKSVYNNGIKSTWKAMKFGSSFKNFFSSAKTLFKGAFNKTVLLNGWKRHGFQMIKVVVTNVTTRLVAKVVDLGLDKVFDLIQPFIEDCVKGSVKEEIEKMKPQLNELAKLQTQEINPLKEVLQQYSVDSSNLFQTSMWQFADQISSHFSAKATTNVLGFTADNALLIAKEVIQTSWMIVEVSTLIGKCLERFKNEAEKYKTEKNDSYKNDLSKASKQEEKVFEQSEIDHLAEVLASMISAKMREIIQTRLTAVFTVISNRVTAHYTQELLDEARNKHIAITKKYLDRLNEKAKGGAENLTEEEKSTQKNLEKKTDDWLKDEFIEDTSRKRQNEIAQGGPLGIPEAQELANKNNVAIEWTTPDGKTILITPEGQNPSQTIGISETKPGHVTPNQLPEGYHDNHGDQNCLIRSVLSQIDGNIPSSSDIESCRQHLAEAATKNKGLQLSNFIHRKNPAKLRRVGDGPKRKSAPDYSKRKNTVKKPGRRSNVPSKADLQECCPDLYAKLESLHGQNVSSDEMNKLFAAHFHQTDQGQQYKENFGAPKTPNKKVEQTFNHMVSDKDCREILTYYFNKFANNENSKNWKKFEDVVANLTCDDLIKGFDSKFLKTSMDHFKNARNCNDRLERQDHFIRGISIAAAAPGNVRIGDAKINSQIGSKPDFPQNCSFAQRKEMIYETYYRDNPSAKQHKKPYPGSSSTRREP